MLDVFYTVPDAGRFAGQGTAAFQAALASRHGAVTPADCDFYHTIETPDGRVYPGQWDLRGHEAPYVGGLDLSGARVLEVGPASGWISGHIARSARLTIIDLPIGHPPEFVPHPGIDIAAAAINAATSADRLRNSWWFTRGALGFDATAFYADIYHLPPDISAQDVAFLGAILLHLSSPFRALQQVAALTTDTIIVTDVASSPVRAGHHLVTRPEPAVAVFNPTPPPLGMTHWWSLSPDLIEQMLHRLGFGYVERSLHNPPGVAGQPSMFTVVARKLREGVSVLRPASKTLELPVPPGPLRAMVSGTDDETVFLRLGTQGFEAILATLRDTGHEPGAIGHILDFGCGVGRVTRYWAALPSVTVEGTDLSGEAIAWARAHLPFGTFHTNGLAPILPFPDGRFDMVYSLSVFTHLPREIQESWLAEIGRVIRPGGLLYLTTHGQRYRGLLTEVEQEEFDAGQVVVTGAERPGSNHCAAFHPTAWMYAVTAKFGWVVVQHVPEGALGNPEQDSWLLRTRE